MKEKRLIVVILLRTWRRYHIIRHHNGRGAYLLNDIHDRPKMVLMCIFRRTILGVQFGIEGFVHGVCS